MNRYTGIVADVNINSIYQVDQYYRYDEMSEAARLTIEYKVRVNISPIIYWATDQNNRLVTDTGANLIFVK